MHVEKFLFFADLYYPLLISIKDTEDVSYIHLMAKGYIIFVFSGWNVSGDLFLKL